MTTFMLLESYGKSLGLRARDPTAVDPTALRMDAFALRSVGGFLGEPQALTIDTLAIV